ncbi:E3 ubiquitin-protein ligase RDUF2-like [Ziziphus jujuba]|uniref:RING-type E3 ubiquitin transferase n=1 Tax=Ziziphus jujuba TaxID=326968 RepID=A0ABM3I3W9_ZIZJJ|nr:E3 ubiquitin-protein ligase RDUF2-like [Ziziphus jujuba]
MEGDKDSEWMLNTNDYVVPIRALNAQGVETVSLLFLEHHQFDYDSSVGGGGESGTTAAIGVRLGELKKVKIESSQISHSDSVNQYGGVAVCAVCLEELSVGIEATCTPCSHLYHEICILNWLHNSTTCPLCRFQMISS